MPAGLGRTTAAMADTGERGVFVGTVGAPGYAVLECEIDVGVRFTVWGSRDSHRTLHSSAGTATPCGPRARPPVAERAVRVGSGATPLAEGSVRRSGECVFTTRPPPSGLLPYERSLAGRPSSPRSEAVARPPNPSPPGTPWGRRTKCDSPSGRARRSYRWTRRHRRTRRRGGVARGLWGATSGPRQ